MTCGATRLIILAWVVGLVGASISGSDAVGWLAAGVAVAIAFAIGRMLPNRFAGSTCALPHRDDEVEVPVERTPT